MELLFIVQIGLCSVYFLLFLIRCISYRRIELKEKQAYDKYQNNNDNNDQQYFSAYFQYLHRITPFGHLYALS